MGTENGESRWKSLCYPSTPSSQTDPMGAEAHQGQSCCPHSPFLSLVSPLRSSGKVHRRVTDRLMAQSSLSTSPLDNRAFLNKHPIPAFPFSLQLSPADKTDASTPHSTFSSQIHAVGVISWHHFIPLP